MSFASRNVVESEDSATTISITFGKLHRVVSLNLAENDRITNKGLAALRGLDFLSELNLDRLDRFRQPAFRLAIRLRLTDACLVHLQALPRLENLSLAGNLITDQGLSQIAKMANLKILDLERHRGDRCRSGPPRGDEEPRDGQPGRDPRHQGGYRAAPDGQAGPDDRVRCRAGGGARSQADARTNAMKKAADESPDLAPRTSTTRRAGFSIRPARPEDAELLVNLVRRAGRL